MSREPYWYKSGVIYQLHVRAFFDANGDGIGDFRGLTQKLDYIRELGVTAIWLLPFYPSPLKDDGYDIADYTDVHPMYGNLADFKAFLREAHKKGLRVITELVLNHTSDQHPWFQRARHAAPGSRWRNFYVWSDDPNKYKEAYIIFKDVETSNWSWDPVARAYYWHRFFSHQPDLNFDNPEVRGVNEEPLAISDIVEQVNRLGQIAPRMIFVNTTTDYFSLRASLGRTGGSGTEDKPLPPNVRMYDVAGASHALIPGTGQCKLPFAILDWHPVMRSTLVALDRWLSANISPPPSELMPLREAPADAMAFRAPSYLPKAIIQIPIRDQDGNATGGVRLPDMAAPLGTHGGQNPPLSFVCSLGSSYVAFAKTKEEREAVGDSRPSLVERYKDRSDYMNRIRAAARDLEQRGFLLTEDSAIISYGAAEVTALK